MPRSNRPRSKRSDRNGRGSQSSQSGQSGRSQIHYNWVGSDTDFEQFLVSLRNVDRVAIDTEFHRERTYWPQLALLQVAAGEQIFLVDTLAVSPTVLSQLADPITGDLTTYMHASEQDLEMLHKACGAIPSRLIDVQIVAGFAGMSTPSLESLVNRFTPHTLTKGDRLADWMKRPLTESQRQYAAGDVAFLFEVADRLFEELSNSGRLQWALDECELARKLPPEPDKPELVWAKNRQTRKLKGKARAVASAVAAWRELQARRIDIPPRFVLSDLGLAAVAQSQPKTYEELNALRGVHGHATKKSNAQSLLEAVQQGEQMNPNQVPEPPRPPKEPLDPRFAPAVALIGAWLDDEARRQNLDRALLATRADVEALLQDAHPETSVSRLASGWRAELVGETVADLLNGHASLGFQRGRGLVVKRLA